MTLEEVPVQFQINALEQRQYLVNGELMQWTGSLENVYSPVYIDGKRFKLGSYPLLGEKEALHALQSAVDAYN